jgi:hypothetical protein
MANGSGGGSVQLKPPDGTSTSGHRSLKIIVRI